MSMLRPLIAPTLNLAAPKSAGRPPRLDFLPIANLRIDESYQRNIEARGLRTIATIHNEFDWNRFAPLIVAHVPGGDLYVIIDGQHRATAALLRGFEKLPCAIVEASALEQPAIFTAVNGTVTPITIFQLFKAARAAKIAWALEIDQACKPAGVVPLLYPKVKREIKPFETMAIGTLRRNIGRFGVSEVSAALVAAARHSDSGEPGFWSSVAIDQAISEHRSEQGKKVENDPAAAASLAVRIRELRARKYSRFAIQAALRCKLSDIEDAMGGAS